MDDILIKKIYKFLSGSEFTQNTATERELINSEIELNVKLNEDYKYFIKNFGGCFVGLDIFGIKNSNDMEQTSFVDLTKSYRKQGYFNLDDKYVISFDGSDNPISMNYEGEVFLSDHDNGTFNKIADSLSELISDNI